MDMDVEQSHTEADAAAAGEVQAFLIADIRGYSTFTSQRGAAAAAHLATTFTDLSRDAVAARGGQSIGPAGRRGAGGGLLHGRPGRPGRG
jgi:class 3 adenylate cyclase